MTDLGEHRRNSLYNHPSSKQHRAEQAAERRGIDADPIASLRVAHREQQTALGAKHREQGQDLIHRQQRQRAEDRGISNGARPPAEWLRREETERRALASRQAGERVKLAAQHDAEMQRALDRHHAAAA
jgi:hypothetical protein